MTTRSKGLGAAFGWLSRGISVGFDEPKILFGAAALVVVAAMLPTLITLPIQFYLLHAGMPPQSGVFRWIPILSMLLGLLAVPLYAGYLQVVNEVEHGALPRVSDIIKPYREGKAPRLIGYGLLMLVIYFAMLAIVLVAAGGGTAHWYMQAVTAQADHQQPPIGLPDGFWITLLLFMVVAIFMMGFYSISLGQLTLRNRSVFGAIGDGLIGALKNVLPLLMLAVSLVVIWIGVALCFGILAFVLAMIGKLVGPWLIFVLIVPLYIALLLVAFTAMFGVMYHLWHDVCGEDIVPGITEPVAA
jgi:hypothetical protein